MVQPVEETKASEETKQTEYVIGIDLGTSNSCVCVWKNGTVEVIQNATGGNTTPSVVQFRKGDQQFVGSAAVAGGALVHVPNTCYEVKRLIGIEDLEHDDTKKDLAKFPFKVVADPTTGRPYINLEIKGGKNQIWPEEVSALVLEYLKAAAEQKLNTKITKAVVTVPAYFNDRQKQATRDAARIAGLEVQKFLNEPTAAALSYGL